MKRLLDKPGNMLYPVPAVMVTVCGRDGRDNIITIAWAGTVCSDPPMVSISVRRSRYSYAMLRETGEFVINLTTEGLVKAADLCGVRSGRDTDKFALAGLTRCPSSAVRAPGILESPVQIECRTVQVLGLGSHDLFLAEVLAVSADEDLFSGTGRLDLEKAGLAAYSHGIYFGLGRMLGTFGFSVSGKQAPAKAPGQGRPRRKTEPVPVSRKKKASGSSKPASGARRGEKRMTGSSPKAVSGTGRGAEKAPGSSPKAVSGTGRGEKKAPGSSSKAAAGAGRGEKKAPGSSSKAAAGADRGTKRPGRGSNSTEKRRSNVQKGKTRT